MNSNIRAIVFNYMLQIPNMEKLLLKTPACSDLRIGGRSLEVKQFPDGESYVRVPVNPRRKLVSLVHRCYPNPDSSLLQLFLAVRQLRLMGAAGVNAIVPYLPYARQDKRFLPGEAMSSETVCSMLKEAGCTKLFTFDCHFLKKEGSFTYGGLRITNRSMGREVVEKLKRGLKSPLVISPDEGASYLTEREGSKGVMKKVRGGYGKGKSAYREVASLEAGFEVRGRDVIIVDDMVAGGSTMLKALKLCLEGGAKSVSCGAVHGLFLNDSIKKLESAGASELVCTNSIPCEASKVDLSGAIKTLL
jgi:ribose-phosphate pyrophosphokinase